MCVMLDDHELRGLELDTHQPHFPKVVKSFELFILLFRNDHSVHQWSGHRGWERAIRHESNIWRR